MWIPLKMIDIKQKSKELRNKTNSFIMNKVKENKVGL